MNGASAYGWAKAIVLLAAVALGVFFAWRFYRKSQSDGVGAALKSSPLGLPSRAIDAVISDATGRDETLGGWLAEIFSPSVRAANRAITAPLPRPRKPSGNPLASPYSINPRERN